MARAVLPKHESPQELGHERDTVTAEMSLEAWEVAWNTLLFITLPVPSIGQDDLACSQRSKKSRNIFPSGTEQRKSKELL